MTVASPYIEIAGSS